MVDLMVDNIGDLMMDDTNALAAKISCEVHHFCLKF